MDIRSATGDGRALVRQGVYAQSAKGDRKAEWDEHGKGKSGDASGKGHREATDEEGSAISHQVCMKEER